MVSVSARARSGRGASRPKEEPSSSKEEPLVFGRASLIWGAPPRPGWLPKHRPIPRGEGDAATIERNAPSSFGERLWFPGEGLRLL